MLGAAIMLALLWVVASLPPWSHPLKPSDDHRKTPQVRSPADEETEVATGAEAPKQTWFALLAQLRRADGQPDMAFQLVPAESPERAKLGFMEQVLTACEKSGSSIATVRVVDLSHLDISYAAKPEAEEVAA